MSFLLGYWEITLEVLILWGVYYMIYLLLKKTAAEQVLKGIVIITAVVMLTRGFNLVIINWLLTRLLAISVIAFLIILQPEIRRGLASIGRFGIFSGEKETIGEIAKAAIVLSKKKTGALIAIARESGLRRYVESGVSVDSRVTSELINTIFAPCTSLHDGGIIVSDQRIEAAACLFPLTQNPNISKTMGTRHRAALGLSEETDAVVAIVSEETGDISISVNGRLTRHLDEKEFGRVLTNIFRPKKSKKSVFDFWNKIVSRMMSSNTGQ